MSTGTPISANLAAALRAYQTAFGHQVPTEIVDKYADRCGPLMLEIRQAVALRQPVQAWLARSKVIANPP
ncbi:MAG: hypothetical protein WD944_09380 [Steroidobacteraceae bacterium]